MTETDPAQLSYEQALELLDARLRDLEDGNLSLDEVMKAVVEARTYLKVCQDRLNEASARIEVRPEPASEPRPSPEPA